MEIGKFSLTHANMSLRDYFAAQSLGGILSARLAVITRGDLEPSEGSPDLVATTAYAIADANAESARTPVTPPGAFSDHSDDRIVGKSDLPPGVVYITRLEAGTGHARAFLHHSGQAYDGLIGDGLPIYAEDVVVGATHCYHQRIPGVPRPQKELDKRPIVRDRPDRPV